MVALLKILGPTGQLGKTSTSYRLLNLFYSSVTSVDDSIRASVDETRLEYMTLIKHGLYDEAIEDEINDVPSHSISEMITLCGLPGDMDDQFLVRCRTKFLKFNIRKIKHKLLIFQGLRIDMLKASVIYTDSGGYID